MTPHDRSFAELRSAITNVRWGPVEDNGILFDLRGVPHRGTLRGRNRDLILTGEPEPDAAIALRTLLDRDAQPQD